MEYLLIALVALVVIAVAGFAILRGRSEPAPGLLPDRSSDTEAMPVVSIPPGTVDLDRLLSQIEWPLDARQEPILVDLQDGTALVLGDRRQALEYGEILSNSGPRLMSASRRASSAVRAGIEAAEQTGHLVRLHPDSVAAFKSLKADQVKDAAGFVYATLRGEGGKYRHVVRIKDAASLQTLSAGAAVISALAMQAQLDRIEKQLGQIQVAVSGVQRTLDDAASADRAALDHLLGEIYRTAHESGQLTPAQWAQLAPTMTTTYALRERTLRELEDLLHQLSTLPTGAKDRSDRLKVLNVRSAQLMDQLDHDDRRVGQAQALRLWHLATAGDPSLQATLADTRSQLDQRLAQRSHVLAEIEAVVGDPDVHGLQIVHTRRRALIRESGFALSRAAHDRRTALPRRLAIGWAEPGSPEDVAQAYTLTPDEAVVLAVAQSWLMHLCARDVADRADVDRFVHASAEAITHADLEKLGAATRALADSLRGQSAGARRQVLTEESTVRQVAADGVENRVRSLLLLIELYSFHPWSPKDPSKPLKSARTWDPDRRSVGIRKIAQELNDTAEDDADLIGRETKASLDTLFGGSNMTLVLPLLATGIAAGVLTAGLAAPAIGAAIGGTIFGLSGAAATSAGLAALGGGSLAAGGLGMAGGTAIISAAGGLLGLGVGAGAAAGAGAAGDGRIHILGRLTADVVKVHVLAKVVLIGELGDLRALDEMISGLRSRRDEVRVIREARTPPDPASPDSTYHDATVAAPADDEAAFREEGEQLETVQKALTRAIDDLLKRRGQMFHRKLPETGGLQ